MTHNNKKQKMSQSQTPLIIQQPMQLASNPTDMMVQQYGVLSMMYNTVVKENAELKIQISTLTETINKLLKEKEQLFDIIAHKNKTIDELMKENAELKEKIELLEQRIKKLEDENSEIRKENAEIKAKLTKRDIIEEYNNIIIIIQDINREVSLEKQVDPHTKKNLNALRKSRNSSYHYIYDDDSDKEKQEKIALAFELMHQMTLDVKKVFDEERPKLIEQIIATESIVKKKYDTRIQVSQEIRTQVTKWFNGY